MLQLTLAWNRDRSHTPLNILSQLEPSRMDSTLRAGALPRIITVVSTLSHLLLSSVQVVFRQFLLSLERTSLQEVIRMHLEQHLIKRSGLHLSIRLLILTELQTLSHLTLQVWDLQEAPISLLEMDLLQ